MSGRSIWIDLDDVLSHTIEGLIELLRRDHGRCVGVEEVVHFDLARSFALDEPALTRFFDRAHAPEALSSLAPRTGAARALRRLRAGGWRVHVVTGRPPITAEASRAWLAEHGMEHDALHFVDKYGRAAAAVDGVPFEPVEAMLARGFDLAVEDSPETAIRLAAEAEVAVALVDRPWNHDLPAMPAEVAARIVRCHDWSDVERVIPVR